MVGDYGTSTENVTERRTSPFYGQKIHPRTNAQLLHVWFVPTFSPMIYLKRFLSIKSQNTSTRIQITHWYSWLIPVITIVINIGAAS